MADKFATLVCKTFTDDIQSGLEKQYGKKLIIDESSVDLKEISSDLEGYIKNRLQVKINTKKADLTYTSFKKQK